MDLGLRDRFALVGGSSRGLGHAVASALAAEGCHLVMNARGEEPLRQAAAALANAHGVRVVPVAADFSNEAGARELPQQALGAFDKVDVLVTNNGGPPPGAFEEHDLEAWRKAFELTVAPHGITVNNLMPGYTRTERLDHLASRIAANRGTGPSAAFDSWRAQIPMNRLGDPAEFGAVAAFLASEQASYVTAQSIAVDGGWIRGLL